MPDLITLLGQWGGWLVGLGGLILAFLKRSDAKGESLTAATASQSSQFQQRLLDRVSELEVQNDTLRDEMDKVEALLAELKAQNRELNNKLNLLESAHNNVPVAVWFKDLQFRMLAINPTYTEQFGVTAEQYVGNTDYAVWPRPVADKYREHDETVLTTGQPLRTVENVPINGVPIPHVVIKYPRAVAGIRVGIGGIAYPMVKSQEELDALPRPVIGQLPIDYGKTNDRKESAL